MNKYLYLIVSVLLLQSQFNLSSIKAQEIAAQRQESFDGISKIIVDADFCAVKIRHSSNENVELEGVVKSQENLESYKLNAIVTDGVLSIAVVKPEQWKSHWGEIDLLVPNNIEIIVKSLSGKVDVNNISGIKINIESKSGHINLNTIEGEINAHTPAGDIIVDNLKGVLKGKSKTGKIILRDINGDNNISTNKGDITITNVNGNVTVDGGSGAQELENIKGNISLKSTSGGIKLSLSEGDIKCRIFTGDLKLFQTNGTYAIQSSTGNITGTRVKFTASSSFTSTEGNIKVQMNTKSDLAFVLKSSNSYLRAMGKSKKKSLKVGKGSIVITGTSTTGSQAYY